MYSPGKSPGRSSVPDRVHAESTRVTPCAAPLQVGLGVERISVASSITGQRGMDEGTFEPRGAFCEPELRPGYFFSLAGAAAAGAGAVLAAGASAPGTGVAPVGPSSGFGRISVSGAGAVPGTSGTTVRCTFCGK